MKKALFFILILASCNLSQKDEAFHFLDVDHKLMKSVFDQAGKYELQIKYTQIDRDENGEPSFHSFNYRLDSTQYFYPASTVKMPTAFLVLEKINELNKTHSINLNEKTTILYQASRPPQIGVTTDSTHHSNLPNLGHYIDKLFAVSDNDAYNRIYEFLGQDYLNEKLKSKNIFTNSKVVHRVGISGFTVDDHRHTNAVDFVNDQGENIISLSAQAARDNHFVPLQSTVKGKGFYNSKKDTVELIPFDMSKKNFVSLRDLEASLMRIVFPYSFSESERYNLTKDQYKFLYRSMLKLPKDFPYLAQDTTFDYYDSYVKFFIFGDTKEPIPSNMKIMNKVGYAYGTLTECAYIFDTKNKVEFMLTATLLVNENGIFNDGKYEYEEVGIPFLAELGRQVYRHELKRERKHLPTFNQYLK